MEILNYEPRVYFDNDWQRYMVNSIFSEDLLKGIYVNEEVPNYVGSINDSVNLTYQSRMQDNIKMMVTLLTQLNNTLQNPLMVIQNEKKFA